MCIIVMDCERICLYPLQHYTVTRRYLILLSDIFGILYSLWVHKITTKGHTYTIATYGRGWSVSRWRKRETVTIRVRDREIVSGHFDRYFFQHCSQNIRTPNPGYPSGRRIWYFGTAAGPMKPDEKGQIDKQIDGNANSSC